MREDITSEFEVDKSKFDLFLLQILVICESLSIFLISKIGFFDWSKGAPDKGHNDVQPPGNALSIQVGGTNILRDIYAMGRFAADSLHR